MTRLLAALVAFVALATGAPAPAGAQPRDAIDHRVKAGDSLALLAAEYYGDRNHQIFIMVANGLQHPRDLAVGERLRIPASREIIADVGDTFDSLAGVYLGDRRRGEFLARFNGLSAGESLAAGTVLSIPFQITHTAAADERLGDIAAAYFGDGKNASLLRAYNFLDRDVIAAGETILVPIHHVRIRSSKLPPADKQSQERSQKRRRMIEEAGERLPAARAAWRQGDYAEVKAELIRIDLDFIDAALAAEIGVLLGGAYVATADPDSALAAFRRVLERRPGHTLDAYTYSPKIRDLWVRAGGQVSSGE